MSGDLPMHTLFCEVLNGLHFVFNSASAVLILLLLSLSWHMAAKYVNVLRIF